ncbi:MAG TPA: hypothetical protein VHD14_04055 [Pseudolabrys sp.]|jgi:hypothetical protein|nr:hypothetical protein [Pseudolabrys sp.]
MHGISLKTALISHMACFAILVAVIGLTVVTRFHRFEIAMHDQLQPRYHAAFAL